MKGLLKGLRYISEIFEADNDKEPEIQIGAPTDVKHVAHIGGDGPSSNAPTWMNDFQGSEAGSSDVSKDSAGNASRHSKSKHSKKHTGNTSVKSSDGDGKASHARRNKNSNAGTESPSQDSAAKKNRKKKRASSRNPSSSSNVDE